MYKRYQNAQYKILRKLFVFLIIMEKQSRVHILYKFSDTNCEIIYTPSIYENNFRLNDISVFYTTHQQTLSVFNIKVVNLQGICMTTQSLADQCLWQCT